MPVTRRRATQCLHDAGRRAAGFEGEPLPMKSSRRSRCALAALLVAASVALSGCGIFGCGGVATNGAAGGGCSAGMRF
jgi:hypothetical protein